MSMVHASQGRLQPISPKIRSETAIAAGVAAATLPGSSIPWLELSGDYTLIRQHIEAVIPGFENFEERLKQPGGFYLQGVLENGFGIPLRGRRNLFPNTFPVSACPRVGYV